MELTETQKTEILKQIADYPNHNHFVFYDFEKNGIFMIKGKVLSIDSPMPKNKHGMYVTHQWLESEKRYQAKNAFIFEVQNNEIIIRDKI